MVAGDNLQQLKLALETMYSNANQNDKINATHFLETFQKSQDAWEIVHTILNDAHLDIHIQLFAAQTLRSKVTYDLSQLPEQNFATLKNSIIQLLTVFTANNQRLVRTQLCVASVSYTHLDVYKRQEMNF